MKTSVVLFSLCICISVLASATSAQTVNWKRRGTILQDSSGAGAPTYTLEDTVNDGTDPDQTVRIEKTASTELRNFLEFDAASIADNRWVTSAVVSITNDTVGVGTARLFDLNGAIAENEAFFIDAGSDSSGNDQDYGSISAADSSNPAAISLNSNGLSALNLANVGGNDFRVGGSISSDDATGEWFVDVFDNTSEISIATVQDNSGPTAVSANYVYQNNSGDDFILDGSGSSDVDTEFGDFLTYEWTIVSDATFDESTTDDMLVVSGAQIQGIIDLFGTTLTGNLTVTDAWGASSTTNITITAVPEPEAIFMLGFIGLLGLVYVVRENKKPKVATTA